MTSRLRSAFTLVELLVVIAIIALLMSILLPALKNAKLMAKMIKEQAQMKEGMRGFLHYASDNHDATVAAAPHWTWNHGHNPYEIRPPDPMVPKAFLSGSIAKTWPLTLWGYLEWPLYEVQNDPATFADFYSRPRTATPANEYTMYGDDSFQAAMNWNPSFGYNGVFIGGSYQHGAFRGPQVTIQGVTYTQPGPNPRTSGGSFYVRKVGDARYPSNLLTLATARGGDVRGTTYWGYGRNNPDSGTMRPGYWLVTAPSPSPVGMGTPSTPYTLGNGWSTNVQFTNDIFKDTAVPSTWGMLFPKHFKSKIIVGYLDGHAETNTLNEVRDMRKWSNFADTPTWQFQPAR